MSGGAVTRVRFQPRQYCWIQKHFGRQARVDWINYVAGDSDEDVVRRELAKEERDFHAELGAAQAQHFFVYRIRERLADLDLSVPDYAMDTRQDETRIYRILRGEILMRFTDVALAHRALGDVWEVLDDEGNGLH